MVHRLVDARDFDRVFDGFAWAFIGCFSKNMATLDASAKHQDGATVSEMAVHAIIFEVIYDIGKGNREMNYHGMQTAKKLS